MVDRPGGEHPVEVRVEVPHGRATRGGVGTDAFEDAGAVVQAVAQHMDLGVAPVHELAVHPDLVDLGDRHDVLLSIGRPAGPGAGTG